LVLGGLGLIKLLLHLLVAALGSLAEATPEVDRGAIIVEVVEYVHVFLAGTVLHITAVGLY
jgi:uncharacterized membrane protein YqhA